MLPRVFACVCPDFHADMYHVSAYRHVCALKLVFARTHVLARIHVTCTHTCNVHAHM